MNNDVSMLEIARVAGVSLSTVSRALAGSPRVKLETRQRIQSLAEQMGYLPNAIARGLATRRTFTIGVVAMDITDPFIAEFIQAIDKAALDSGYSVILSNCRGDPQREMAAINSLRQRRVDGIVVPDPLVADTSLSLLEEAGIPIVLFNKKQYPYSICTDNVGGAEQAVRHLLDLGHKRIAYLGKSKREDSHERQRGYKRALLAAGISPDPALIVEASSLPGDGWYTFEQLLDLSAPPTAVFCFDDLMAVGIISAAQAAGLRVPDHLSVVGFDDISLGSYLAPPLTTIAQQVERMSHLMVDIISKLLDGHRAPMQVTLPGKLVVRATTVSRPN